MISILNVTTSYRIDNNGGEFLAKLSKENNYPIVDILRENALLNDKRSEEFLLQYCM